MILQKIKRKIYKLFHPAVGEILMLHRVVENRSVLEANRQMEITPEFLEKTLQNYQRKGYQFVSLDEVYEIVSKQKRPKPKFVCFTFDDGYVDNYELAYPIFKKYNCPFAIYVTTDFPDGKALLWWYRLEEILLKNVQLRLSDGSEFNCSTNENRNNAFKEIRNKIFSLQSDNMVKTLNELFLPYTFDYDIENKQVMSWKHIITLSKDQLCTIASHSISHSALDWSTVNMMKREVIDSKYIIEKKINLPVLHFAYPYGRYNDNICKTILEAGYRTAVLANGDVERTDANIIILRRIVLIEK